MLNPLCLAIVATTVAVIASARPSAAFVGSLASSALSTPATHAAKTRLLLSAAATRGGGGSQSLTMGSPPLGAGERVVIVGGGIGKKKSGGWKTGLLMGTAMRISALENPHLLVLALFEHVQQCGAISIFMFFVKIDFAPRSPPLVCLSPCARVGKRVLDCFSSGSNDRGASGLTVQETWSRAQQRFRLVKI